MSTRRARRARGWLGLLGGLLLSSCGGDPPPTLASAPPVPAEAFLYVGYATGIRGYRVDGRTGALEPVADVPLPLEAFRYSEVALAYDEPTRRLAVSYYADRGGSVHTAYVVDAAGALHPVTAPLVLPTALVRDPRGRFAYGHAGGTRQLEGVRLDPATGVPAGPLPGSPFALPSARGSFHLHPSGRFAYWLERIEPAGECLRPGRVHVFRVSETGDLEPVGSVETAVAPLTLRFVGAGRWTYVIGQGDDVELWGPCREGSIVGYEVDATSGLLTPLAGSPFMVRRGLRDFDFSSEDALYARYEPTRSDPSGLVGFRLDESHRLVAAARLALPSDLQSPGRMLQDVARHRLYLTLRDELSERPSQLAVYRTGPGASLQPIGRVTLGGPNVTDPRSALQGRYLYALDADAREVRGFDAATDALAPIAGSAFAAPSSASSLLITSP
jgi:hypothetical protein